MTEQKTISVYIAGKVSKDSVFGTEHWRDDLCRYLEEVSGYTIKNLDPTQGTFDELDARGVVGRDLFLIHHADLVIVYLSDDISVGGSQEILLAKYFGKPVIGYCKQGGKFFQDKEIYGKIYANRKHPFIVFSCDVLVHSEEDLGSALRDFVVKGIPAKTISCVDDALSYYTTHHYPDDVYVKTQTSKKL